MRKKKPPLRVRETTLEKRRRRAMRRREKFIDSILYLRDRITCPTCGKQLLYATTAALCPDHGNIIICSPKAYQLAILPEATPIRPLDKTRFYVNGVPYHLRSVLHEDYLFDARFIDRRLHLGKATKRDLKDIEKLKKASEK